MRRRAMASVWGPSTVKVWRRTRIRRHHAPLLANDFSIVQAATKTMSTASRFRPQPAQYNNYLFRQFNVIAIQLLLFLSLLSAYYNFVRRNLKYCKQHHTQLQCVYVCVWGKYKTTTLVVFYYLQCTKCKNKN